MPDCPDSHSSYWAPGTSPDKRELLFLGSRNCHYNPEFFSAFDLAGDLKGMVSTSRGWYSRHNYGELLYTSVWLPLMKANTK